MTMRILRLTKCIKQWVVSLDYSMTCPAITIIDRGSDFQFERCQIHYISNKVENKSLPNITSTRLPSYTSNEERFDIISDWAMKAIQGAIGSDPVEIFMEGYSMKSKGRVFEIAENTGLVKHKLYKAGHEVHLIPPTVIKKRATGKGNAKKKQMYEAFFLNTQVPLMPLYQPKAVSVGSPVGDIVDSFFIALCGWEGL